LDEDISDCSFTLKKNCLKIIKVEEYSPETYFSDPCRTFVLHDVICEYCTSIKDLDFCKDKYLLNNSWICDQCGNQYDKNFIEFLIIQKVKKIVDFFFSQDLKCAKCKMQKNELLNIKCSCSGEFQKTFEENIFKGVSNIKRIEEFLDNLSVIAKYYSFDMLNSFLEQII